MSRTVIRQFLLAVALITTYHMLWLVYGYTANPSYVRGFGSIPNAILHLLPLAIVDAFPLAAGVSLALLAIRPGAFRQGMWVAASVTLFGIGSDLFLRPMWDALEAPGYQLPADAPPHPVRFDDTTSALGGALAHLRGLVGPQDLTRWPPDTTSDPRFATIRDPQRIVRSSAVAKYHAALDLLSPLILCGIALGLGAWLTRIAIFRSPRDEKVARLLLSWGVIVAVHFWVQMTQRGMWYSLGFPRVWIGLIMLPTIVAAIPAFLGWRAAWRLDRLGAE